MYELTQKEMDRLSDLALGHEKEWLDEYIDILKSNSSGASCPYIKLIDKTHITI